MVALTCGIEESVYRDQHTECGGQYAHNHDRPAKASVHGFEAFVDQVHQIFEASIHRFEALFHREVLVLDRFLDPQQTLFDPNDSFA